MKNKKNGFTLIELLAVIVILAIVALIAIPIVLDIIDDARISAGNSEAYMILSSINNYCESEEMKYQIDNSYDKICTSSMNVGNVKDMINLGNAEIKEIAYDGEKLTTLVIESNNHKFTLCPSGTFAMDDEKCDGEVGLVGISMLEKTKELVYENETCKTDGTTYQYMGGCYLKGNPNNNYIWYSGFLWRIMGINADKESVKLILDESVTAIPYHEGSSNWNGSYAKDWLNNYFYKRLKGNNIIKEVTWCSETITNENSARTECTTNLSTAYVGLITLDEYNLAGGSSSYLNMGQYQWTMTPYDDYYVWDISNDGNTYFYGASDKGGLRAVINVKLDATITGGNGTLGEIWSSESGPYILNEVKNIEITGKLNEKSTSGEYVLFAGKKYRVVDKDSDGNTKLILDGYYEEKDDIPYTMKYGNDNLFTKTQGIGLKLNIDVLDWLIANSDTENRNKLVVDYTWYQNNFEYGDSYTISLEETNPTRSVNSTIGLIRVGEMLSGQSSSVLTKGYTTTSNFNNISTYWTMTPDTTSSSAWAVAYDGNAFKNGVSSIYSIRPVIVVTADITITKGNGTWSNPYEI